MTHANKQFYHIFSTKKGTNVDIIQRSILTESTDDQMLLGGFSGFSRCLIQN